MGLILSDKYALTYQQEIHFFFLILINPMLLKWMYIEEINLVLKL